MIYGQPITFGGAGGNELIVTAPAGSTVTATKDGKTKTVAEKNGVWAFKGLEAGEWTVTASLNGKTKTSVVTVGETLEMQYWSDTFADNEWGDIIAACQSGNVPETWAVGNSKPMTINGTSYQVDIIGKNHDTYTAGGTAPLTFQLHDCYDTAYNVTTGVNVGGYSGSEMHTAHLPAIKNLMPTEVKNAIKPVNKETGKGGGTTSSGTETISCDLFLLAEIEIFGTLPTSGTSFPSRAGEGSQYDYYKAGNSKIKKRNGSACAWWERSPVSGDQKYFCTVTNSGTASHAQPNTYGGVSFAFCF